MTCIMKVEMCYNKIKIGLEAFAIFPNLRFLKLRGNRISSFDEVHKLSCVKLLQSLDLQQNPVALDQDYRSNVFNELEQLEVLDNLVKGEIEDKKSNGDEIEFNPNVEDEDENRQGPICAEEWIDDHTSSSDAGSKKSGYSIESFVSESVSSNESKEEESEQFTQSDGSQTGSKESSLLEQSS